MWNSVGSLAALSHSGHRFKATAARDGGRPVFLAVLCFQEQGEVLRSPCLFPLGKMSVQFVAFRRHFDAEDVNS